MGGLVDSYQLDNNIHMLEYGGKCPEPACCYRHKKTEGVKGLVSYQAPCTEM